MIYTQINGTFHALWDSSTGNIELSYGTTVGLIRVYFYRLILWRLNRCLAVMSLYIDAAVPIPSCRERACLWKVAWQVFDGEHLAEFCPAGWSKELLHFWYSLYFPKETPLMSWTNLSWNLHEHQFWNPVYRIVRCTWHWWTLRLGYIPSRFLKTIFPYPSWDWRHVFQAIRTYNPAHLDCCVYFDSLL